MCHLLLHPLTPRDSMVLSGELHAFHPTVQQLRGFVAQQRDAAAASQAEREVSHAEREVSHAEREVSHAEREVSHAGVVSVIKCAHFDRL